jgi:hypothetical protein
VRPLVERRDLTTALQLLNDRERNREGRWQLDNHEMTSAVKFLDNARMQAASLLDPVAVVEALQNSFTRAATI